MIDKITISNRPFIRITGFLQNIWTLLVCITWGVWWGGLTFYAVVVVPIGTSHLGSVEQGFVTQQVTIVHNWLSVLFLLCLIIEASMRSSRFLFGLGIALSILTYELFRWHSHLSSMINFQERTVHTGFYQEHAIYLWLIATEWIIGLIVSPMLFLNSRSRTYTPSQQHRKAS